MKRQLTLRALRPLTLVVALALGAGVLNGCPQPREGIAVSNTFLDFDQNPLPRTFFVWNADPDRAVLNIALSATAPWILLSIDALSSSAPGEGGATDRRSVIVDVDRTQLPQGTFTGFIELSAPGYATKRVGVRVVQPTDGRRAPLNIENTQVTYSEPYLLDFNFALRNAQGEPVVAEPAAFEILARESERVVGEETGVHLRRTTARQLKLFLVLDYSLSLQNAPGAIAAMENAASQILLPVLNEDAQVGVVSFHRDDRESNLVSPLSVDRAATIDAIAAIQPEVVQGFASGSRLWDALTRAAVSFGPSDPLLEERYIVAFSDGNDTSSFRTVDNAASEANQRNIAVYTVGYGTQVNAEALRDISQRTGGTYFPAASAASLGQAFGRIAQNLEGQYILRWATLRRNNIPFLPSFQLTLNNAQANFVAKDKEYVPRDYFGDVLEGKLRFVTSPTLDGVVAFLRADYVPRQIAALRMYVEAKAPFTLSAVPAADDGLIGAWTLEAEVDPTFGGTWITASSAGEPLSFATFGPLLRFDFEGLAPNAALPITRVFFDDSLYTQGQRLRAEGFPNRAPDEGEGEGSSEGSGEGEGEGQSPGLGIDFCAGFQAIYEESLPSEGEPEGTSEGEEYDPLTQLLQLFEPGTADLNGTFFLESNEEFDIVFNITGNGILDADNELGLLRRILNDGGFDNGVLRHTVVAQAFLQNRQVYRTQYLGAALSTVVDLLYPGIVDIIAGYITIGDGNITVFGESAATGAGSFGIAAGSTLALDQVARSLIGIGFANPLLDKAAFVTFPQLALNGDADGDTYTNFEEYRCTIPSACFNTPPLSLRNRLYVNNALDAELRAQPCLDNKRGTP